LKNTERGLCLSHEKDDLFNLSPYFKATFVLLLNNLDQLRAADYRQKIDYNTNLTIKLLMKIEPSLSTSQRAYLLQHIYSQAADFDKLSCDPDQLKP